MIGLKFPIKVLQPRKRAGLVLVEITLAEAKAILTGVSDKRLLCSSRGHRGDQRRHPPRSLWNFHCNHPPGAGYLHVYCRTCLDSAKWIEGDRFPFRLTLQKAIEAAEKRTTRTSLPKIWDKPSTPADEGAAAVQRTATDTARSAAAARDVMPMPSDVEMSPMPSRSDEVAALSEPVAQIVPTSRKRRKRVSDAEIAIAEGKMYRTVFGLPESATDVELEQRIHEERLKRLCLPADADAAAIDRAEKDWARRRDALPELRGATERELRRYYKVYGLPPRSGLEAVFEKQFQVRIQIEGLPGPSHSKRTHKRAPIAHKGRRRA